MTLVPLTGGFYQAQSLIASAQSCINLYPEKNPQDSPVPLTTYLAPGLTYSGFRANFATRSMYTASNGNMYMVTGVPGGPSTLYGIVPNAMGEGADLENAIQIGTLASAGSPTPVSMADNGIVMIIVDGTTNGWALDLTQPIDSVTNFGQITDPNFLGATRVDYLDTFFILNVPGTNQWYISLSEVDFAQLTGITGSVISGSIVASGASAYTNGFYPNTPLTGGSGSGAIANITVTGNGVSSVVITSQGNSYISGDVLSATLPGSGVQTIAVTMGGTGYTNGTYTFPLINEGFFGDQPGNGSGGTVTVVVGGGTVVSVTPINPGSGYAVGDTMTVQSIPGGTGNILFTVTAVTGSGFAYTVDTVGGSAFDPTDIATKAGYPDPIVTLIVMHLEIWLIGTQTTEVWYNAGAADFAFQILPGVFIEHGCAAPYSIAKQDLSIYWLSIDKQGHCVVLKGNSYAAHRISTFAIETEFSSYSTISDAIGFTYQQRGHTFYGLTFPTADKSWFYDESTELWHERVSLQKQIVTIDGNDTPPIIDGNMHKIIYNSLAVCGGLTYVGDYLGFFYELDPDAYTEAVCESGVQTGVLSIPRIRSFPHLLNGMKRNTYQQFIADMECGTNNVNIPMVINATNFYPPAAIVNLRWSDDRGKTYNNYVQQSMGEVGKYLTNIQWRRLGYGRDRVFELSWSTWNKTALNGAWIDATPAGT